ncbi:DUF2063 domain-containing protein [Nereida sp. MMG025]|uniref:HvfC/BufC N-terminal domain-containing protein n=1 Tax=Nereida sp. MMG025 TaxID=2909981 RepID=UPI001F26D9DB|nr:DNA-binding domain-containing protein [Nereida sp. MMG025]MCF6443873.1 DNA-binding domain-containing protein [Nereida sp. MMG025]
MICQDAFTVALLDPSQPTPAGLIDPQGQTAPKRFAVYRNNVAASLTEALRTGFPVIRKLVGDRFFDALAGVYLRAHPPKTPLMMHYGQELPAFLQGFPPAQNLPYLADVARLELAMRESYHAKDAAPIEPSVLAAIPPETLMQSRIALAPSAILLRSRWPIYGIWAANMLDAPTPQMHGEAVLIMRPEYDPTPHLLPAGMATFLIALETQPLGAALDTATAAVADFDLGAALGILLAGGAITSLTLPKAPAP